MRKANAKGINFRSFVSALRRLRGDRIVEQTFDLLPKEIGEALRVGAITTGGWYPCQWYSQLHSAAQRACGEGTELSRACAKESIQEDFRGVYRLITLSLTPESLFKWAPKVAALYYDMGRAVIEQSEAGRAMGRFEGYGGFDRNLWEDMTGGAIGALEVAGAKNVVPRLLAGGGDGDDYMGFAIRWTP